MSDIEWIESLLTLHGGFEMLYVVDGYQVTVTANDGNEVVCVGTGETLQEAVTYCRDNHATLASA